jgi:pyruvate formate lyase activating enzyme
MPFGGLQKNSLIDFPGKLSCVLFFSGCNFDCPYCHNPELVHNNAVKRCSLDERTLYGFLDGRKALLDGVVVSGGEPTLNKDLLPLCEKIKQMGFAVKLDTNGSRPRVIKRLIDEALVDYIAMDIKTDPFQYAPVIKRDYKPDPILTSIEIVMGSPVAYEFRSTCAKLIVNEQVIENIAKIIKGANLYALQRFKNTKLLHPEFFEGTEPAYADDELMFLKSIAEPWVKEVIVR